MNGGRAGARAIAALVPTALVPTARVLAALVLAALAPVASTAWADVRSGVDAWTQGDYDAAIAQWREPAARGDPDAMFNMGQACKLGRGMPRDLSCAEDWFRRAALKGHVRAADNYGILLFQTNRQADAMPWLTASAERGEPRAMYILGIAAYNGDYAAKDWVRAYALMTRAAATGLAQAMTSLSAMNEAIPLQQRQMGAALAQDLEKQAESARARDMGAADLGTAPVVPRSAASPRPARAPSPAPDPGAPAPLEQVDLPPAALPSSAAVTAGADYANPVTLRQAAAPRSQPGPASRVAPVTSAPVTGAPVAPVVSRSSAIATAPATAAGGTWRIQFGAFGQKGNADTLWTRLRARPEIAGHPRIDVPAGAVTRLMAGGYTQATAEKACAALKAAGQTCLVVGR